jgi:hypothetical protein
MRSKSFGKSRLRILAYPVTYRCLVSKTVFLDIIAASLKAETSSTDWATQQILPEDGVGIQCPKFSVTNENRKLDNVPKYNNCINIPSEISNYVM